MLSVLISPKVKLPPDPAPALNVISPSTVRSPLIVVSLVRVIDSLPVVVVTYRYGSVGDLITNAFDLFARTTTDVSAFVTLIVPPSTFS